MYPMQTKPKKRINPDLMGEAADMAAEQMQIPGNAQQAPPKVQEAPIVPTTNMRLPNMKTPPAPQSFGGTSGMPAGGMMGGMATTTSNGSMNVTGAGDRAAKRTPEQLADIERWKADYNVGNDLHNAVDQNGDSINGGGNDSSQAFDDLMNELLTSGPRDTTAEEEQIRNQMQKDVSSNQAGLNARIAAGGGGTSGALGALSTDMRSRAALDAANAVTGVQSDARDEYLQKAKLGMDAEINDRKADMSDAQFDMYMQMMEQLYGSQSTPTESATQRDRANSGDSSGNGGAAPPASTTGPAVGTMPTNPIMTDEPPAGAQYTSTRNGVAIYVLDGKYYGVRE